MFLGQKFEFWGQIARKQEFSQIHANIPQIGNHKYYNLGEFEKICRARIFLNFTNAFFHNSQKTTFYLKISDKNVHKTSKSGAK